MKTYKASAIIRADAAAIWNRLVDVAAWPSWNPTVEKCEGRAAAGARVVIYPANMGGRAFPVQVAECVPRERLVFVGGMPLGLFRGTRTFTLTSAGPGAFEVTTGETFTGLLAPLITRVMPDLQPSFDAFVQALKKASESPGADVRAA